MVDLEQKCWAPVNATLDRSSDFKMEIADARTTASHELEMLLENGLSKVADLKQRHCLCR
jgi:UDP-3-O-acyl-N-acetylglucosamine deacetylase